MGYDNDGTFIFRQKILQPADGMDVQMVGGLVQQHDIRLAEQCLCQQNLHLFRIGTVFHSTIQDIICLESQTLQQAACFGICIPAVQISKFRFQLCGTVAVLFRKGILGIQGIFFLHDFIQTGIALNDGIQNGKAVKGKVVLTQDRHTQLGIQFYGAGRGLQIAGQHTQKGGLAGTVGTDDAIAVAFGKF